MKLTGDKVLVHVFEPAETTAAGLFIPLAKRVKNEGVVLLTGPRVKSVSIGNKIRFYKGFGTPYTHEGKKCLFLKNDEIELVL